ncbi:MAG: hypothetical protein ACE5G3_05635 [Gammaproteobacteria bacterium]
MSEPLECYRCGASLDALTLPLSRQDQCPDCSVYLHCCRMCGFFDPGVAEQCREDDAEEVNNKEGANFCDYFAPRPGAYDPGYAGADRQARSQLDGLFAASADEASEAGGGGEDRDDTLDAAEDLFR